MVPKNTKLVFCIALLIALFVPCVSAEILHPELVDFNHTISFADLGLTGSQDIQVWQGATLIETANTTAGYIYAPIGDYTVVVKPTLANRWLNNPAFLLKDGVDYILAFFFPIFIILCMIGIAAGLANYGRRH